MTRAFARGDVVLAEQLQLIALGGGWLVSVIVRGVWDQFDGIHGAALSPKSGSLAASQRMRASSVAPADVTVPSVRRCTGAAASWGAGRTPSAQGS